MAKDGPKDFFISYTQNDQRWAEWIAWHLEDAGYTTILQAWDFLAGGNFVLGMDDAAKQATRTIAVLSPDYFASKFTPSEWAAAFRHDPKGEQGLLMPVRVRPCDVEGLLGQIVYIDLLDQDEPTARATLLQGVKHQRRKPANAPAFPFVSHTPPVSQRPSFPGALPAIWNIPYPRNPYFTGREGLLTRLAAALRAGQTVGISQPQAVSGLGGIGKTQIALEYAYRYHQDYDAVLWTRADTTEALISGFVAFASLLSLPVQEEKDQLKIVQAVKTWLTTHPRWLLILDNADDLSLLKDFLPPAGRGHTLLTTRAASMGRLAQRIEVDTLGKEPGAFFLLRRAGRLAPDATLQQAKANDRAIALTITQELGGLPLALDQAGAYIEEIQCGLADYLQLYRSQRAELLKTRGGLVPDHPEPVATTWSLSFKKVEQANPTAADLLRLCAFLAPDAIPEEIFTKDPTELGRALRSLANDEHKLNMAMAELLKYSLVHRNPETKTLTIHRLVQAALKDEMDNRTQRQWAERTMRTLNRIFPVDAKYKDWSLCRRLIPHVLVCEGLIRQWGLMFPEAARLLNGAGLYLWYRPQHDEAELLFVGKTGDRIGEGVDRAQYDEAELLFGRAIAIAEKTMDSRSLDFSACLNNLALVYIDQHKYEQAEPLLQKSLAVVERVYRSKPLAAVHLVHCLNNLASVYWKQSKYEQAEPLFWRAIAIGEERLGFEDSIVAISLDNLGLVYRDQRRYEQAEPLFQRSLMIKERILLPNDPSRAKSLHNLALCYSDQGKYAEAEPMYQQALRIWEQALEPDHPDVAYPLNGLAALYREQGKYAEAEPLYIRALHIFEQALGPDHPNVAYELNNLAILYKEQGKYAEAEPLYQRALRIWEQAFGRGHHLTQTAVRNYAILLREMGRETEAQQLEARFPSSS